MDRIDARTGLAVIDPDDCRALLDRHARSVGRLALVEGGHPTIFPVNYAMDGDRVAFRTAPGSKLDAALRHTFVAFEIDGVDDDTRSGWSVVVKGWAEAVETAHDLERLEGLGLEPWSKADHPSWILIHAHSVTGRRIR